MDAPDKPARASIYSTDEAIRHSRIYEQDVGLRLELTPRGGNTEPEVIAQNWFNQLKKDGLIPENATFDGPIIVQERHSPKNTILRDYAVDAYHEKVNGTEIDMRKMPDDTKAPQVDPQVKTTSDKTYRDAMIGIINSVQEDYDGDGYKDVAVQDLVRRFEDHGITQVVSDGLKESYNELRQAESYGDHEQAVYHTNRHLNEFENSVATALVSQENAKSLRRLPPAFSLFCNDAARVYRPVKVDGEDIQRLVKEPADSKQLRARFEKAGLDPYSMEDAIVYFKAYSETNTDDEVMTELQTYSNATMLHVENSPLRASRVSDDLRVDSKSRLDYFAMYQNRAVVDCYVFTQVAKTILNNCSKNITTKAIAIKYFDLENGHAALLVKTKDKYYIVNNGNVTPLSKEPTRSQLVRHFTSEDVNQPKRVSQLTLGPSVESAATKLSKHNDNPDNAVDNDDPTIRENATRAGMDSDALLTLAKALENGTTGVSPVLIQHAISGILNLKNLNEEEKRTKTKALRILAKNLHKIPDRGHQAQILRALYKSGMLSQEKYLAQLKLKTDEALQMDSPDVIAAMEIAAYFAEEGEKGIVELENYLNQSDTTPEARLWLTESFRYMIIDEDKAISESGFKTLEHLLSSESFTFNEGEKAEINNMFCKQLDEFSKGGAEDIARNSDKILRTGRLLTKLDTPSAHAYLQKHSEVIKKASSIAENSGE
ncbi:hypothetical protein KKA47_04445 [bacterium]|nr:hypothetical protein [bacterium]